MTFEKKNELMQHRNFSRTNLHLSFSCVQQVHCEPVFQRILKINSYYVKLQTSKNYYQNHTSLSKRFRNDQLRQVNLVLQQIRNNLFHITIYKQVNIRCFKTLAYRIMKDVDVLLLGSLCISLNKNFLKACIDNHGHHATTISPNSL
jgi:hypothetical protein